MRLFFDIIFALVTVLSIEKYCLVSATPERNLSSDADEITYDASTNCTARGINVLRISDMVGSNDDIVIKAERRYDDE